MLNGGCGTADKLASQALHHSILCNYLIQDGHKKAEWLSWYIRTCSMYTLRSKTGKIQRWSVDTMFLNAGGQHLRQRRMERPMGPELQAIGLESALVSGLARSRSSSLWYDTRGKWIIRWNYNTMTDALPQCVFWTGPILFSFSWPGDTLIRSTLFLFAVYGCLKFRTPGNQWVW